MAALVLSVAGAAAGAVFGPAGAIVGRIAGALVGNIIDQKLFGWIVLPINQRRFSIEDMG